MGETDGSSNAAHGAQVEDDGAKGLLTRWFQALGSERDGDVAEASVHPVAVVVRPGDDVVADDSDEARVAPLEGTVDALLGSGREKEEGRTEGDHRDRGEMGRLEPAR